MSDPNELGIAVIITTVLTTIGLIITIIINSVQLRGQKNQLFIANFGEMTSHIGDEETKKFRSWLFYDEQKRTLFEQFKKEYTLDYNKQSHDEKITEIEKAVWHLASRYDRLGVLLDQDKKIRKRVLDYHGQVISKLWLTLEPIIDMRESIEKDGAYRYFRKIGREAVGERYSSEKSSIMGKKTIQLTAIAVVVGAFITIFYNLFNYWLTEVLDKPEQEGVKITLSGVFAIVAGLIIYRYYVRKIKED